MKRIIELLKVKNLNQKPNLKLMPNHYKVIIGPRRAWNSKTQGQAISNGNGWYR